MESNPQLERDIMILKDEIQRYYNKLTYCHGLDQETRKNYQEKLDNASEELARIKKGGENG